MFKAIEESNGSNSRTQEEFYSSSSNSVSREIEGMHKQL